MGDLQNLLPSCLQCFTLQVEYARNIHTAYYLGSFDE